MPDSPEPTEQPETYFEVQRAVTEGDATGWWPWVFDGGAGQQSFSRDEAKERADTLHAEHPDTSFRVVPFGTGPRDKFSNPIEGEAPPQPEEAEA